MHVCPIQLVCCFKFFIVHTINNYSFRGNNAKTPEYFEDLFCNLVCYQEYRMRTSNRFIRQVRTFIIFKLECICLIFVSCFKFQCSLLEISLWSFHVFELGFKVIDWDEIFRNFSILSKVYAQIANWTVISLSCT